MLWFYDSMTHCLRILFMRIRFVFQIDDAFEQNELQVQLL